VISAVGTAHELGIVHRDLKPANIFLAERLEADPDVRVLDFGVAKFTAQSGDAAESAHLTRTGEVLGTPYYMPPEQVFGEHDVDHRVDIWAVGVILYECLAGRRPFEGSNAGQILKAIMMGKLTPLDEAEPRVPDAVAKLVGRMLTIERGERPKDLREVMEILKPFSDVHVQSFGTARIPKMVVAAGPVDPFSATTFSPAGKKRWPLMAGAAAAVALLGGVGVWKLRAPTEVVPRNAVVAAPPALSAPPPVAPPVAPPVTAPPAAPPVAAPPPVAAVAPAHHSAKKKAAAAKPETKKALPGGVVEKVPF